MVRRTDPTFAAVAADSASRVALGAVAVAPAHGSGFDGLLQRRLRRAAPRCGLPIRGLGAVPRLGQRRRLRAPIASQSQHHDGLRRGTLRPGVPLLLELRRRVVD
jgi:hypothetical protein